MRPRWVEGVGVLGVVLGEQSVGGEGVVDAVADGVAQLGLGHPAVEGQGHDEGHVVHPGVGGHVQHLLDHQSGGCPVAPWAGRGSEMSSKAMVSLMPGRRRAGRGSWSPTGWLSAARMAAEGSFSGSSGSGA